MNTLKTAMQDMLQQARNISGVVYAAVFNNQVKEEQDGKTFDFPKPALLIEIETPNTGLQALGGYGLTVSELNWRISIVHEQLDAADGTLDQNLDVYDYRDAVKTAFTSFKPQNCGLLQYREESQDYAHNNIYVYGITFACSYVDYKGSLSSPNNPAFTVIDPPIGLFINAYYTLPIPLPTKIAYGWKVCPISIVIVDVPNPANTQQLGNGDIIPIEYVLNPDNTVTIPELASYPAILVLNGIKVGNQEIETITIDYNTGVMTNYAGGFYVGADIDFNASLPLYVIN